MWRQTKDHNWNLGILEATDPTDNVDGTTYSVYRSLNMIEWSL